MNFYAVTFVPTNNEQVGATVQVKAPNSEEAVYTAFRQYPSFVGYTVTTVEQADPELERLLAEEEEIQYGKVAPQPDPAKVCFNRIVKKYAAPKLQIALDNYVNGFCTLDQYVERVQTIRYDAIYNAMYGE